MQMINFFFLIFELNLVYLTSLVTMGQCGLELFTCYLDSVGVFFPAYLFETASLLVPPVHFLGFWEQCFQNYLLTGVFIPTRWVRPAVVCTFYFAYTTIIASSCAVGWDTQFFMLTPLDDVVLQAAALITLLVIIAINLAIGILPHVDNFAHIGGFLTGFFLGFVLLPRPRYGWLDGRNLPGSAAIKSKYKTHQYVLWLVSLVLLIAGWVTPNNCIFVGESIIWIPTAQYKLYISNDFMKFWSGLPGS